MDEYYKIGDKIYDYSIIKLLGEGRYGIAYLCMNDNEEKYVIKQLKNEMLQSTRGKLFYEKQLLESLNYSSFPKFISNFHDGNREGYILEYKEGKVFEDIVVRERYKFKKSEIYAIANDLLDLIEILHENNIVHRDIRLPNVIVDKNNKLSLIDFGLARIIDNKRYLKKIDYWYIGDFLIHLYYTNYIVTSEVDRPWFKELDLSKEEVVFLKKLLGLEKCYKSIYEIRKQLEVIKNINL